MTRAALVAILRRPDLWWTAVRTAARMRPDGWWRGRLSPGREYLDYRGRAVFGMPLAEMPADELVRYLEWCRSFPGPVT